MTQIYVIPNDYSDLIFPKSRLIYVYVCIYIYIYTHILVSTLQKTQNINYEVNSANGSSGKYHYF